MFTFLYYLILFTPLFGFFHFGGIGYIIHLYSNIIHKVKEFQEMKKAQKTTYLHLFKNIFFAFYSLTLYTISQKLNNNVERLDKHTYLVSYLLAGQMYKVKVKAKKGMAPVEKVTNDKGEIVTEDVMMYAGPNFDWHHQSFTPKDLGYNSLTFYYFGTDETHEFKDDEIIGIKV